MLLRKVKMKNLDVSMLKWIALLVFMMKMAIKIGHDLNVAERLRAYQTNIRKIKEMFYDKQAKEGFDSKLKEQLSIISKYESQRDANGNLLISMEELMKVPEYREAKEWIRKNTRYILDIKDIEDLNWAFEELKDANKGNSVLNLAIKEFQAKDEFNVVDGRKIPEERAALIKAETVRNINILKVTVCLMLVLFVLLKMNLEFIVLISITILLVINLRAKKKLM